MWRERHKACASLCRVSTQQSFSLLPRYKQRRRCNGSVMPVYVPHAEFSEDHFTYLYAVDEKYAANIAVRRTCSLLVRQRITIYNLQLEAICVIVTWNHCTHSDIVCFSVITPVVGGLDKWHSEFIVRYFTAVGSLWTWLSVPWTSTSLLWCNAM